MLILDGEDGEGVSCRESRAKEVPSERGTQKGIQADRVPRKPFPDRLGNENIR